VLAHDPNFGEFIVEEVVDVEEQVIITEEIIENNEKDIHRFDDFDVLNKKNTKPPQSSSVLNGTAGGLL